MYQELSYATYLNIQHAILPPPRNRAQIASYARTINYCLKNTPFIHLSVRLPIYDPFIFQTVSQKNSRFSLSTRTVPHSSMPLLVIPDHSPGTSPNKSEFHENELNITWEMWDVIRSVCEYSPRLTLSALFFVQLLLTHSSIILRRFSSRSHSALAIYIGSA